MKNKCPAGANRARRLSVEKLESRIVLDGNVQASVRGGTLGIIGDSNDNEITVSYGANVFTVASRDGSTTINGQPGPLTFSRVGKDVSIAMGNGNDVVEFDGGSDPNAAIWIRRALNVDMGSGADQLLMTNVHTLRLALNMGTGDDLLNIGDDGNSPGVLVTKEANIASGNGADDIRIANSQFKRSANVNLGINNDTLTLQGTTVHKKSIFDGGPGTDTLNRENNHGSMKFLNFETVNNSVTSPAPLPPVANNDTASVVRNGSAAINVAANDTSATSTINDASITITKAPTHGTAVANSNGTVSYTNNGDAAGTDSFQYTIKDQSGTTSNVATANITITDATLTAANDTGSVAEDAATATATGNVLANDTGGVGAKTVTAVNGAAGSVGTDVAGQFGTFHINADGSFTYTLNNSNTTVNALNSGQTQTDSMAYTASAGGVNSNATLTITINGHTDLVTTADTANVTEDATPNSATGNVLSNDTGGNGNKTVTAVNNAAASVGTNVAGQFGTFHINSDGSYTYTLDNTNATVNALNNGGTLTDSMNYTASDGIQSVTGTLTVTINGHTELVATNDTGAVTEDSATTTSTGNVLDNDTGGNGTKTVSAVNGQSANVGVTINGTHGTFNIASNGAFTYTLNNADTAVNNLNDGQTLTDSMTYTVTDGVATTTATLTITITGHTDGP